jgi:L-lysine 2,3-aminomutase
MSTPQQTVGALQEQIDALRSQNKNQQQQIVTLEAQRVTLTTQAVGLEGQVNDDAKIFQAVQNALRQPGAQPARMLPAWAAYVMSKLPQGTVL